MKAKKKAATPVSDTAIECPALVERRAALVRTLYGVWASRLSGIDTAARLHAWQSSMSWSDG